MSLKLNKFLLEFGENSALFIENFVPLGNVKWALPIPSIKSAGPDIVLTVIFVGFSLEKIFYVFQNSVRCSTIWYTNIFSIDLG